MEDCVVFWWIRPQTLPNMYLLTHTSHKASQFEVFVNGGLCGVLVWAVTHGWLSFGFPAGHLSPRLWPVACGCSLVKKSDLSLDLRLVLRQWSGISTCHSLCMKTLVVAAWMDIVLFTQRVPRAAIAPVRWRIDQATYISNSLR